MKTKKCTTCGTELTGRQDKKFCSDACRIEFHNLKVNRSNPYRKIVQLTLRRNLQILEELFGNGISEIPGVELEYKGFSRMGLTGIEKSITGSILYYCYEYMLQEQNEMYTIRKREF